MATKVPQNVLDSVWGSVSAEWRQHDNGKGWVYKTARVDPTVYLHPTSIVSGNAQVSGNALVYDDAQVYGKAQVSGNAQVHGDARVAGNAQVSGDARVSGNAQVYGDAWVYGKAQVSGDAWVFSPLYIQGTRHAVTLCSHKQIAIGCHIHDITEWQKKYRAIGRMEGYTPAQIKEYGAYIVLLAAAAKVAIKAAKVKPAV